VLKEKRKLYQKGTATDLSEKKLMLTYKLVCNISLSTNNIVFGSCKIANTTYLFHVNILIKPFILKDRKESSKLGTKRKLYKKGTATVLSEKTI